MDINIAMKLCHDNKVIISPVGTFINSGLLSFYITVNGKKIPIKDPKEIKVRTSQKDAYKELNNSIVKTYIFYANKLNNKSQP